MMRSQIRVALLFIRGYFFNLILVSGVNEVTWDGTNDNDEPVANGGYICVIKAGDAVKKRKIAVLK